MKYFKKPNFITEANDSNKNIIIINTIAAFLIKGGALIVSFFTTPAFIRFFNNNSVLGIWYTMLSILIWFLNFDLGIGNGIRNNLVKDFACNDRVKVKKTISSGFFSAGIISVVLTGVGIFFITKINLFDVFNLHSVDIPYIILFWSTLYVFFAVMLRFFLSTITSIFYAMQKSSINNFIALCISIFQLIFVQVFHYETPAKSLLALSIAYLIISNVPLIIAGVILFTRSLKDCKPNIKYVDKKNIKKIINIGVMFFYCQILYMLIMNTNEFLITNQFGPQFTTDYSFYYKLMSLISTLIALALDPIWSIVTKAMAENDYIWLRKLYRYLKYIGFCAIVLQFVLIPFLQPILNIWLGKDSITVNYFTALAFSCFESAFVYSSILSTIVCGLERMKLQAISYSFGVIVKFLLVYLFSKVINDWSLVVWSNAIILVPYCIFQHIDINMYLNKKCNQ